MGDLFDTEVPPLGFSTWNGDAIKKLVTFTSGSLYIRGKTAPAIPLTTTEYHPTPSLLAHKPEFSVCGAPKVIGQIWPSEEREGTT